MESIPFSRIDQKKGKPNYSTARKLNIQKIRQKLKELQTENKSRSNEDLNHVLNQILENLDEDDPPLQKLQAIHDNMIDRIETKPGQLPGKYFMARNSLITDLVEIPHLKTVRNFFIAVWVMLLLNAVATDIIKRGRVTLGFHHLIAPLNNIHTTIILSSCMFASTIACYCAFFFWAAVRVNFLRKTNALVLKIWDSIWLMLFVTYCTAFIYFSLSGITDKSYSSQILVPKIIVLQMVCLFLKIYAFVRSNAPRVLKYKLHDEDVIMCPGFTQFLYFSLAPTFVYKDSYPRTSHVRWNYFSLFCTQLIGALMIMHFIQEYILEASFENYDLKNITLQDFILITVRNVFPNTLYWICFWFVTNHAGPNIFGEILQFADRLFYKDWWNCILIDEFYCKIMSMNYDWLYTYVYKDMYEIIVPSNKIIAKIAEFHIFIIVHETIYSFPYGFYYIVVGPVCIIPLVSPYLFRSKNFLFLNTWFLCTMIASLSLMRTYLTLEYAVRMNCPVENETILDYFIPRTFTCYLYQ